MENENTDRRIIYAPLPVDRPYPVPRPSSRIQLAPTVYPVAISPFITETEEEASLIPAEKEKTESRLPVQLCGLAMFTVIVFTAVMFILGALKTFPLKGKAGEVMNLGYFVSRFGTAFKPGSVFEEAFPAGLVIIGLVACAVNLVLSIVAMVTGKRPGYGIAAFVMFMSFAIAALCRLGVFSSDIVNIAHVLDREYGWASVMLLIICSANALVAFLCACICPKDPIVGKVDL